MTKIFCVEDDPSIRELIVYTLNASGFLVEGFDCAESFFSALKTNLPQMVLLDIMLPDIDGIQILKKLRMQSETSNLPIILLTAKSDRLDKIKGLDYGADDYITKPFDILELISRIKAVLRRSTPLHSPISDLSCESILIKTSSHKVYVNDHEVALTYKEYELLKLLVENKNTVMSRATVMNKIWGVDFEGETRTVDVHIRTLRQKLGDGGRYIETVRNVGYRAVDDVQ